MSRFAIVSLSAFLFLALPANAATLMTLATFNGANGTFPLGRLLLNADGDLLGTTLYGGSSDSGTVFRLSKSTGSLTTVVNFNGVNGYAPTGQLYADGSGNLFGSTAGGGANVEGTVFRIDAGNDAITTLASFNDATGYKPFGALIADTMGNLIGTTALGGANDDGTVFKVNVGTGAVTTLATFNGLNGREPEAGLVADTHGNLFGTTVFGGTSDQGTVFKIDARTGALATLVSFSLAGVNGAFPESELITDANGNLLGEVAYSLLDMGSVFRIDARTGAITRLATFDRVNGSAPRGGLLSDAAGNLFGTSMHGGAFERGTVFRIDAGSGAITTLATFNGANGGDPEAGLIADANGDLFGTTLRGGASEEGTVFSIENAGFVAAAGVPEPSSWAMILAGFAIVGFAIRRHPSAKIRSR